MAKTANTWRGILAFAVGHRWLLVVSALLSAVGVICGVAPYLVLAWIAAAIIADTLTAATFFSALVAMAVFYLMQGILQGASTLVSHRCAFQILENIRNALTEKMERLSMGSIWRASSGEYKNLILDEVEKLEYPLAHAIPEVSGNLGAFLLTFALMLAADWRLALAALITIPVGVLIMKGMFHGYAARYARFMEAGDALNKTVVEYLDGIEVIKIFGRGDASFDKLRQAVLNFRDFTLAWYRHNWPFTAAYSVVLPASIVGVLPLGSWFVAQGAIELSTLLLFVLLSFALISPLIKLSEFVDNLAVIIKTEQEVRDFLAQEEPHYEHVAVLPQDAGIVINHARFSYGGQLVLDDVSVVIPPRSITAIVGGSGAGKTTLLRLLARYWDLAEGSIEIGGVDVRAFPQSQLAQVTSIVDQDAFLFDRSIRDNILLGRPDASEEALARAIELAECGELVARLENGLDTVVSAGGARLSGGERQRVCLARAILKDAPILLLDEPTANLDLENEYKIQQVLLRMMADKTVVLVSHRLRMAVPAQQILVMAEGRLVDCGRHEELLARCEEYARLWRASVRAETWQLGGAHHD